MSDIQELQTKIAEMQAQVASMKAQESAGKLAEIKVTVAEFGFTAEDIFGSPSTSRKLFDIVSEKVKTVAPAKYRGPNGETWSGRGLKPRWLSALVDGGHSVEEYLIEPVAA